MLNVGKKQNGKLLISYVTLFYLKDVAEKLDRRQFIRVHRSYLVSIAHIEDVEITVKSARIPIRRNYRKGVIEWVVNRQLWKK